MAPGVPPRKPRVSVHEGLGMDLKQGVLAQAPLIAVGVLRQAEDGHVRMVGWDRHVWCDGIPRRGGGDSDQEEMSGGGHGVSFPLRGGEGSVPPRRQYPF